MNFQPNGLFFIIAELFSKRVNSESKLIIGNEGGSRSSKTWDTFHFIVALCEKNRDISLDIYILRDTLVNCRDFTLKDFQDCLKVIGIYDPKCMVGSPKPVYKLFGHNIKFRGMDEGEGYPSDVIFFNEILDGMKEDSVKSLVMRCRKLVIADWNPKYTTHWFFEWEKREDTVFLKSTYKNNRHLQLAIIKEIESYNPSIEENIINGTADKYRWKVYGEGERANREGLVFPDVNWIDDFPIDIEEIAYGIDFGETAQTAIVKCGVRRLPNKSELYLQKLFYHPTENSDMLYDVLKSLDMLHLENAYCDNNQPGWVSDLRMKDVLLFPTKKFDGSREYWVSSIKRFNINIVKDIDFRKEQENFCY